jgi:hypothetical protein
VLGAVLGHATVRAASPPLSPRPGPACRGLRLRRSCQESGDCSPMSSTANRGRRRCHPAHRAVSR